MLTQILYTMYYKITHIRAITHHTDTLVIYNKPADILVQCNSGSVSYAVSSHIEIAVEVG